MRKIRQMYNNMNDWYQRKKDSQYSDKIIATRPKEERNYTEGTNV